MSRYKDSKHGKLAKHNFTRVNSDGSYAEDYYSNDPLDIKEDKEGFKYVNDGWDNTYIDEAVISGFKRKPKFSYDEGYIVEHIDGDVKNCNKDNLRWKELDKTSVNTSGHAFFDGFIVGKDGTLIFETPDGGHEKAQMQERYLDDDLNRVWIWETPIAVTFETYSYGPEPHEIEDYMDKAGYIAGDKDSMKDPQVLHRDMDVCNFKSDNLEWVETTDPRYIEYDKKRKQRQKDLIKQYNSDLGYSIPEGWPQ